MAILTKLASKASNDGKNFVLYYEEASGTRKLYVDEVAADGSFATYESVASPLL